MTSKFYEIGKSKRARIDITSNWRAQHIPYYLCVDSKTSTIEMRHTNGRKHLKNIRIKRKVDHLKKVKEYCYSWFILRRKI